MTRDAYNALADCARRRIEQEWSCTEAERAVLSLITELSFCLGQSLALVPCLADFAAVTGLHKSTISRAIRSALKKGYLEITKRREETLYAVSIETPADKQAGSGGQRDATLLRLIELNEGRLQGVADGNGQQRLPGILESEETEAPARAFAAMTEAPQARPTNSQTPPADAQNPSFHATRTRSDAEQEERLARLTMAWEKAVDPPPAEMAAPPAPTPAPRPQYQSSGHPPTEWLRMANGLSGDALYALELIRDECASAGKTEAASFYQFLGSWRTRVTRWPRQAVEAAGVHKAMRLEGKGANKPGAFIYRTLQVMTTIQQT